MADGVGDGGSLRRTGTLQRETKGEVVLAPRLRAVQFEKMCAHELVVVAASQFPTTSPMTTV